MAIFKIMNDRLLSLIQDLQKRVEKLEKDNKDLKKWAYREKKKVNVIAWLNEHYLPTEDFLDWVKTIKISELELLSIFHDGLARGISGVLREKLPLEERRHLPIIAFKHQITSTFYIYEKTAWRKIKKNEFKQMVKTINREILVAFNAWERAHPEMLDPNNVAHWGKRLKCVLMPDERVPRVVAGIQKSIHTHLSLNIKTIVEYDFDF